MRKPRKTPNYMPAVLDVAAKLTPGPGTVTVVDIYHDDWCAIFEGLPCNCNPDVKVGKRFSAKAD